MNDKESESAAYITTTSEDNKKDAVDSESDTGNSLLLKEAK